jgi:hypothetical protein
MLFGGWAGYLTGLVGVGRVEGGSSPPAVRVRIPIDNIARVGTIQVRLARLAALLDDTNVSCRLSSPARRDN